MVSRQEFMRRMEAPYLDQSEPMRLPFAYTSMDGACVAQSQQIWEKITGRKSRSAVTNIASEWAV
jgi:hypothetical protein